MDLYLGNGIRNPPLQAPPLAGVSTRDWALCARPLSDIREATEPSLFEAIHRKPVPRRSTSHDPQPGVAAHKSALGNRRPDSRANFSVPPPSRNNSRKSRQRQQSTVCAGKVRAGVEPSPSPGSDGGRSSIYSIPVTVVPPRSSSRTGLKQSGSFTRIPIPSPATPRRRRRQIWNHNGLDSPIKPIKPQSLLDGPGLSRAPSKTIIKAKNSALYDVVDHPSHLHPRVKLALCISAPLFVGGSSVEGSVRIKVDEADRLRHRKALTLERVSVDLLGIEEVSGAKRHVFLALGNELVDMTHPPPDDMIDSWRVVNPSRSWILLPSVTHLPFLVTLPLEVGPPPFQSKHAKIRYVLAVTLTIKDDGRLLSVRCSQDITVLSVYDPEKALVSLPSPLTASDEYRLHQGRGAENIMVTAGLHRQVWVSGTDIFTDVHIINNSRKTIRRMELQLERIILCYRHVS